MKMRVSSQFAMGLAVLGGLSLIAAQNGLAQRQDDAKAEAAAAAPANPNFIQAVGPDVTVFNLSDIGNYGSASGIRGYAVGTTSCNIGDTPLNWCDAGGGCGNGTQSNDHPVIAQNLYRLKNGRFDQIGASWLKHGFLSVNSTNSQCGNGSCVQPPLGDDQLGVGCTDPYGSGLNGSRPLGRKSEVNASSGDYPFPPGGGGSTSAVWNQRMAVAEADLAPSTPEALFYVEGHYIAPDDAAANNGRNNASYRRVTVGGANFALTFSGGTVREKSAIDVWPTVDPSVELIRVETGLTPIERFNVARKVTDLGGGVWHYEYAVHNMNSDRGADLLAIEFFEGTTITNVGFKDIDSHSGEPYDTTDWEITTGADSVTWAAPSFSPEANANALRWSTLYNFWFDATRPPGEIKVHTLDLFKAGLPSELMFWKGVPLETPLFADGFESGTTANWIPR
jgi:hypothetical protein